MPWDWFWKHRWSGAAGALALDLPLSAAAVLSAPPRGGGLLAELYRGRRANPQMFGGRADAKMYLYLAGATLLELNLLSFAAHHFLAFPADPSPGIVLHVVLFAWFVCDYLVFERAHLYTLRFLRRTPGVQARLGVPVLVSVLLRGRAVVHSRPCQPARAPVACPPSHGRVLLRMDAVAGRKPAEVQLQTAPGTGVPGPAPQGVLGR